MKKSHDEVTLTLQRVITEENVDVSYRALKLRLENEFGRDLEHSERQAITTAMRNLRIDNADIIEQTKSTSDATSDCSESSKPRFLVLTAYKDDEYYYKLGSYCSSINRFYCKKHGYYFREKTMSSAEMQRAINPRQFGSYYKIRMLLDVLMKEQAMLLATGITV